MRSQSQSELSAMRSVCHVVNIVHRWVARQLYEACHPSPVYRWDLAIDDYWDFYTERNEWPRVLWLNCQVTYSFIVGPIFSAAWYPMTVKSKYPFNSIPLCLRLPPWQNVSPNPSTSSQEPPQRHAFLSVQHFLSLIWACLWQNTAKASISIIVVVYRFDPPNISIVFASQEARSYVYNTTK